MMNRICILFLFILSSSLYSADIVTINTLSQQKSFNDFAQLMIAKKGFTSAELADIFKDIKIKSVSQATNQFHFKSKSWQSYRRLHVNEQRVLQGVDFWNKYQDALTKAEKTFGVPASIIVATIGMESKYGQKNGNARVLDSLTNFAFDSSNPRSEFFRNELAEFLLLCREQHLDTKKVMGSYAGAIGQPQFMPSSYRRYAINFSGNSSINLSENIVDVIGSVANYYKKNGWRENRPVAVPASMSGGQFQFSLLHPKPISVTELLSNGLITETVFQNKNHKFAELQSGYQNEYWFLYKNFDVIKRYNNSAFYAMAVYQLSYYLTRCKVDRICV